MIKSISTIEGLGGCGKTTYFLNLCTELLYQGKSLVYLTFNKRIADQTTKKINDKRVFVSTIHSLMYQELDIKNMLPEKPIDYENGNLDKKETSNFFKKVEKNFLAFFNDKELNLSLIKDGSIIFVDEYQNIVEPNLYKCLKLIGEKIDIDYCFIGDRYQSIYNYLGHGKRNFFDIKNDFGVEPNEPIVLNKNYRSNASVLSFINSYLANNIEIDNQYLYIIDDKLTIDKQQIHFFTTRKDELEYIKAECLHLYNSGNKTIAILSRWKRNLKQIKEWIDNDCIDWIEVSTIHGFIGNEKDIVFIVGSEYPETIDEKIVLYTGLIRAKERLILTSSHPVFDSTKLAGSSFIEVFNHQKEKAKPFKQLKHIKENKNLTLSKFEKCVIDSLSVTVRGNNVPFIPYIEHNNIHGDSSFIKSYIDNNSTIPIRIGYHKAHENFTFIMNDVNLLRRSGYSDLQVVQFLINFVIKYFNYQIKIEDIKLTSIDICRVLPNDDDLVTEILEGGIKCRSLRTHKKDKKTVMQFTRDNLDEGTLYYNFTSPQTLTMALYHPNSKENENRYFNKEVTKIELRLGPNGINRKYAFGKNIDMLWLLSQIKSDKDFPKKIFDRIINYRKK